jgi:hypothetical protein
MQAAKIGWSTNFRGRIHSSRPMPACRKGSRVVAVDQLAARPPPSDRTFSTSKGGFGSAVIKALPASSHLQHLTLGRTTIEAVGQRLAFGDEFHRHRIEAIAQTRRARTIFKHMAKV